MLEHELFKTPKDVKDIGSPACVYRVIRWNEAIDAYELVTGVENPGYSGDCQFHVYTLRDKKVLRRVVRDLEQYGVARFSALGTEEYTWSEWDHPQDLADRKDISGKIMKHGQIFCELHIMGGALAPFTPILEE